MATFKPFPFVLGAIVLFCFVQPTLAFGAGNIAGISKVEGQNCELLRYIFEDSSISPLYFLLFLIRAPAQTAS